MNTKLSRSECVKKASLSIPLREYTLKITAWFSDILKPVTFRWVHFVYDNIWDWLIPSHPEDFTQPDNNIKSRLNMMLLQCLLDIRGIDSLGVEGEVLS